MIQLPLTVLIPIYNEEKNILNAINSAKEFVDQILIVDSNSTDNSITLAKECSDNIDVINIPFISFSDKMNKALLSSSIRNDWVMRLDADEIVVKPDIFFATLKKAISTNRNQVGFYVNRRYYFLNHWMVHGSMYPRQVARIWRKGEGVFEDRLLDEKMIFEGETDYLDIDIADIDQKGFLNFVKKHIKYAKKEALESFNVFNGSENYELEFDKINRENKKKYYKMPIFLRPFAYLFYRLIVRKGYRDGIIGVIFHFLHAFIYRETVDFFIMKQKIRKCF